MSPVDPGSTGSRPGDPAATETRGAESATAQWYRHFGTVDAPGNSDCYAAWSVGNGSMEGIMPV